MTTPCTVRGTKNPLIKSLEVREAGAVIEVDFGETRGRRTMVG